jgi:hypothetical protein
MTDVDSTEILSALDANIKEKGYFQFLNVTKTIIKTTIPGQNAYYFAHSLKINGPAWDGKEEPRLLHVEDSPKVSTKIFVDSFESYAWLDDGKYVKIYVDYDRADTITDANVTKVMSSYNFLNRFNQFCCRILLKERLSFLSISMTQRNENFMSTI